jgi:hypothetical protein
MRNELFAIHSIIEDGTMSHGLGGKAGKTLHRFNDSLANEDITRWFIVLARGDG